MKQENTEALVNRLKGITDEKEAERFIRQRMKNTVYEDFHTYLQDYVVKKHLDMGKIIKNSRINSNYVYQIVNGKKKNIGRDYVLALCLAAGMDYNETNRGLAIAKAAVIYPKNPRDVKIVVAINQKITDILQVNQLLDDSGMDILKV